jgi:hypothetical protein
VLDTLAPLGVDAILRPGVDDDVVGLICCSPLIRNEIEENISRSASEFGLKAVTN